MGAVLELRFARIFLHTCLRVSTDFRQERLIQMTVSWDDKSFLIKGERKWIIAGSLQYWRIPHQEWEQRLKLMREAGLNTVEFYICWQDIEAEEGVFDFSEGNDVVRLLELCKRYGFYVIIRPGPYICAEQFLGGFPPWLLKKNVPLRKVSEEAYFYIRRFWKELFERIGKYQISESSDGPIILAQVENEYWFNDKETLQYLSDLAGIMRECGVTVPFFDCNMLYNEPEDSLHTINGAWNYPENFVKMRRRHPEMPLFISEFHCGWFTTTGKPKREEVPVGIFRDSMRYLSRGAMKCFYIFCGGTNFGNSGARIAEGDYATASYEFEAPVAEGGGTPREIFLDAFGTENRESVCGSIGPEPAPG